MGDIDIRPPTYVLDMSMVYIKSVKDTLDRLSKYSIFNDERFKDRIIEFFKDKLHTNNEVIVIAINDSDLSDDEIVLYLTLYGLYFDPIYTDIIMIIINDMLNYIESYAYGSFKG